MEEPEPVEQAACPAPAPPQEQELGPFQMKARNLGVNPLIVRHLPPAWPIRDGDIEDALYEAAVQAGFTGGEWIGVMTARLKKYRIYR